MQVSKTIVVLSGGLDSTVALALAKDMPSIEAITFYYGQRHTIELQSARRVAKHYRIPLTIIPVDNLLTEPSSLLGDGDIPQGAYDQDNMASTVVQGRNLLFASIAVSRCGAGGSVWMGVHGGDHHLYPDCRPEFWEGLQDAVLAAYQVELTTPFLAWSKAQIVMMGDRLAAPLHLTYSCYEGGEAHCGRCGTCLERREAFREAGVLDPTRYEV